MKQVVFQKFPNPVFIETGTYVGDGVQAALDFGFEDVHSIELSEKLYDHCCRRFAGDNRVHIHCGDSTEVLEPLIADIAERITFWLDGHFHPYGIQRHDNIPKSAWGKTPCDCTNPGRCPHWSPLFRELVAIAGHARNDHTILIDDVREFKTIHYEGDIEKVKRSLLAINPEYIFTYHEGAAPNDILAASIEQPK